MALDAVYIRARNRSPDGNNLESTGWQRTLASASDSHESYERRSSSPPSRIPHKPGLGSYSTDYVGWHSLRTGEPLASKALRMRQRFVRATHLSDPSLPLPDLNNQTSGNSQIQPAFQATTSTDMNEPPSKSSQDPTPTLAQLYSQLAQDMQETQTQISASPPAFTSGNTAKQAHGRDVEQANHHAHRHRHHPDARHRSEWFISRALTKMRRAPHTSSSEADTSTPLVGETDSEEAQQDQSESSSTFRRRRCPRCGDTLPPHPTAEEMARHRQSIAHRLGLNAPVSSASASEAPSPAASEAPTPAPRSRSSSPIDVSLLDASMQALHRRSGKLPRRLSNAPRWKKIARDNVGHNLLSRMGWKEGMGLGVQEWKWQQLRREKLKRQRSNAVRALLQRQSLATRASLDAGVHDLTPKDAVAGPSQPVGVNLVGSGGISGPEPGNSQTDSEWMQFLLQQSSTAPTAEHSSLQVAFPFQYDTQDIHQQREAAQIWLSTLSGPDAEWFQVLTPEEQQSLERALLSGQMTLLDIQNALLASAEAQVHSKPLDDNAYSGATEVNAEAINDMMPSNAVLYPVQVELRTDRGGIGSKPSFSTEGASVNRQRRRSRDAEGSVEIRRPSSPSMTLLDTGYKKSRSASTDRSLKPLGRSRSHSSAARKHAVSTRRQRELVYQKDRRDWLDLRASLS
ncbi:uncharacterized protein UTRI_01686_B [Ustilago trichophora]|uniref:G-patch domain-containing protein n=1 Tax=Ustilago trichophora TaxID=86804 RepID=A0A5C3E3L9_9BASI|nr:uncharacterized protein UTRI_01686_B [Ustilago trichophora]